MHATPHPAVAAASLALWGLPAIAGLAAFTGVLPCDAASCGSLLAALAFGVAAAFAPVAVRHSA